MKARTKRVYMALQLQEIANRIAQLRLDRGSPPQEVVAQRLGVSHRTYQSWELGEAKPSYANLEKLAVFYGVTEDYILTGAGEVPHVDPVAFEQMQSDLDEIKAMVRELFDSLLAVEATEPASSSAVPELPEALLPEGARASNGEKARPRSRSAAQERRRKSS